MRLQVAPGIWEDRGPAAGFHHRGTMGGGLSYSGDLVVGLSGSTRTPQEAARQREHAHAQQRYRERQATLQPDTAHQGKVYATEEERIAARRATWRASKARAR